MSARDPQPVSDAALLAYAKSPVEKAAMITRKVLGTKNGALVVADFDCSDLCPQYTVRIIHYKVEPGPECDRVKGVVQSQVVPRGIASIERPFCVPAVLAKANFAARP